DLAGARRSEFSALTAEHDGAVPDGELRVADDAAGRARAETLGKSEGAAEPLNRSGHVLVHQNWDHRRTRGGAVQDHGVSASNYQGTPKLDAIIHRTPETGPCSLRGPLLGGRSARPPGRLEAIPRGQRNWMVFSLNVHTTREDGWDRDAIVR